jgi:hypothetical protein
VFGLQASGLRVWDLAHTKTNPNPTPNSQLTPRSYILLCSVMLLNVVIAVLLDEFIASVTREREEEARLADLELDKRKVLASTDLRQMQSLARIFEAHT